MSPRTVVALVWAALFTMSFTAVARAQEHGADFCYMLDAIRGEAPERVGEVVSGVVVGERPVTFRRPVARHATYVLLVALTAPATGATVLPVERAGDEAPGQEGLRVAHDFSARTDGRVTISFRAPPGTAYHAALFRLPQPRAGLGVRPSGLALRAGVSGSGVGFGTGGSGSGNAPPPRPPECRPPLPARLRGSSGRD